MTPFSSIDAATLAAYRETEYRVLEGTRAVLKIGVACPQLLVLHRTYQTDCSTFITACNPLGAVLGDADNARRQAALAVELARRGLMILPGIGQHPTSGRPGEPSFLVLDAPQRLAQELGRQFAQNAVVWAGAAALPELILLS